MLCPLGDSLNGSQVSHLPDFRSIRCTPANPLFCAHTLPSTPIYIGLVILICVLALFSSGGMLQTWNVSVFLSNFAMLAWYIMPSHKFWSLSKRTDSAPVGEPFFLSGTGYSVCLPVLESSLPSVCSPKLEYQTIPSASTITSWGSIVGRGKSYSVMTTRVALPVGRGNVLRENSQVEEELKLIVPNTPACVRWTRVCSSPTNAVSLSPSRNCGCSGVLCFT